MVHEWGTSGEREVKAPKISGLSVPVWVPWPDEFIKHAVAVENEIRLYGQTPTSAQNNMDVQLVSCCSSSMISYVRRVTVVLADSYNFTKS